jgi:hypothetical protein
MRTSISKSMIAGLAALSLIAPVFAATDPASAGYKYRSNTGQARTVKSSVCSRPTSAEGNSKLALRDVFGCSCSPSGACVCCDGCGDD